jgi:hypothetical protein
MSEQAMTRTMFQVRLHGRGGQDVVTVAELLAPAAFREDLHPAGHRERPVPDPNIRRFGLAPLDTERAGVAAPATPDAGTAADHFRAAVPGEGEDK